MPTPHEIVDRSGTRQSLRGLPCRWFTKQVVVVSATCSDITGL